MRQVHCSSIGCPYCLVAKCAPRMPAVDPAVCWHSLAASWVLGAVLWRGAGGLLIENSTGWHFNWLDYVSAYVWWCLVALVDLVALPLCCCDSHALMLWMPCHRSHLACSFKSSRCSAAWIMALYCLLQRQRAGFNVRNSTYLIPTHCLLSATEAEIRTLAARVRLVSSIVDCGTAHIPRRCGSLTRREAWAHSPLVNPQLTLLSLFVSTVLRGNRPNRIKFFPLYCSLVT